MEINDIVSHIMTKITNTDELNHLKKVIKMRKEDIARDLKYTLKPGDKVKINRTKVVVRDEDGQGWTVPLTMIRTGE